MEVNEENFADELREAQHRLVLQKIIEDCKRCGGLGWLDDPTACGDPDHCDPMYPCACNPEGIDWP